jgi:hypothetical protein
LVPRPAPDSRFQEKACEAFCNRRHIRAPTVVKEARRAQAAARSVLDGREHEDVIDRKGRSLIIAVHRRQPETSTRRTALQVERRRAVYARILAAANNRRSRPEQWADAVQTLADMLDQFQEWRDKLPSNLANSATAEALDAVLELRGHVEDLQAVELPKGFGRD